MAHRNAMSACSLAILLAALVACSLPSAAWAAGRGRSMLGAGAGAARRQLWSDIAGDITYRGGEVMTGNVSARIIYLGYKPGDYMHLLTSYVVDNLADTYFYRTVTRYYKYTDSTNTTLEYASGALRVESTWFYPQPAALYMPDPAADEATNVAQFVASAIRANNNTPTANDLYIVIASNGTVPRAKCSVNGSVEAGWADYYTDARTVSSNQSLSFTFAFVPEDPCFSWADATNPFLSSVWAPLFYNPEYSYDGPMIDSMVATLASVITEAVVNPTGEGWYGANVNETITTACGNYFYAPMYYNYTVNASTITGNPNDTKPMDLTIQYTDLIGEVVATLPLIYDPSTDPSALPPKPWGCVGGLNETYFTVPAIPGEEVFSRFDKQLNPPSPPSFRPPRPPSPSSNSRRK